MALSVYEYPADCGTYESAKTLLKHSVHPPLSAGGGVEPPTKFSKRGDVTGPQLLEVGCWERGGDFFHREDGRGGGKRVAIFT